MFEARCGATFPVGEHIVGRIPRRDAFNPAALAVECPGCGTLHRCGIGSEGATFVCGAVLFEADDAPPGEDSWLPPGD